MATSHPQTKFALQLVGESGAVNGGQPLSGQTVQLKLGALTYDGIEIVDSLSNGSGAYEFTSVLAGNYTLYVNGSATSQTVSVGAGELEKLGFDDDKFILSSVAGFLYKTYAEVKTLLGLNNVNNVAVPDPSGETDGKILSVSSGSLVYASVDLSTTAADTSLAAITGMSASNVQTGIEELYNTKQSKNFEKSREYLGDYFGLFYTVVNTIPETESHFSILVGGVFGVSPFIVHLSKISGNWNVTVDNHLMIDAVRVSINGSNMEIYIRGGSGSVVTTKVIGAYAYTYLTVTSLTNVTADEFMGTDETIRAPKPKTTRHTGTDTAYSILDEEVVLWRCDAGATLDMPTGRFKFNNRLVRLFVQNDTDLQTTDGATIVLKDGTTATSISITSQYYCEFVYNHSGSYWDILTFSRNQA